MRKLVEVENRSEFDKLNKTEYNRAIVFIKDTKEIWTHGTFYTGELFYINTSPIVDISTSWTKLLTLGNLTEAGTYAIQIQYGGILYSGIFSFSNYNGGNTNSFIEEEIPLHASGNKSFKSTNEEYARIYLKIGLDASTHKETLFIAATKNDGTQTINLKIKQLL